MILTSRLPLLVVLCTSAQAQIQLNQIQVIGSHNSYHAGLAPSAAGGLRKLNPKAADGAEYKHPALDAQLSSGVRQVEIDIFADTKGGLYSRPANVKFVSAMGLPADP